MDSNANSTTMAQKQENVSQGVLYIPSIAVAVSLILFLGISFYRYHLRAIEKKRYLKEYAQQHLNTKRERIRGYVYKPQPVSHANIFATHYNNESDNYRNSIPVMILDEPDNSISEQGVNTNGYPKKPQTPKSYFDHSKIEAGESSSQYQETNSNIHENAINNDETNSKLNVKIPVSMLCNDCKHTLRTKRPQVSCGESLQVYRGEDNPAYFSDSEGLYDHHRGSTETAIDAFHGPSPHHSTKKKKRRKRQDEFPSSQENPSRHIFPPAHFRMGVINLDKIRK
ncbi:hypothetical protein SNE40_023051 [Patella caerulea]|uniref:Uncharacterized protein n=1 Tax=Patella caerulea TaxID=87958 RepID=A0AAN8GG46_PATCE